MGKEITHSQFNKRDFSTFETRLREETALLRILFERDGFSTVHGVGGFEVECWLIDSDCNPLPDNERFLDALGSPLVVPELAKFNVEMNTPPILLRGIALQDMRKNLDDLWNSCNATADALAARLLMIGILPTVEERMLSLANISEKTRYRVLNEQIMRFRQGAPIELEIPGFQPLHTYNTDVMLESAATSLQIHLQVKAGRDARFYNAAIVASAPMVAVCANSPYLFGHDLWDETRIPLFEQAVSLCPRDMKNCPPNRVDFGRKYVHHSILECFLENLDEHPVLIPEVTDGQPQRLSHLRLHNGTIWRWNRPLIGFDTDGKPHLRIEHRVAAAGPSVIDTLANAALFFGMTQALATDPVSPESKIPFERARSNFYSAARQGLSARITWIDSSEHDMRDLLLQQIIPTARRGLADMEIDRKDSDYYLGIVEARVASGRNGAGWQRAYVKQHGPDMRALTAAYAAHQRSGKPVHEWSI